MIRINIRQSQRFAQSENTPALAISTRLNAARPLFSTRRRNLVAATALLAFVSLPSTLPAAAAESPSTTVQSQTGKPRLRLRIAVDQFKWTEIRGNCPLPSDLREGLQAALIQKLQESGGFQVMEREATALSQDAFEDTLDQQKRHGLPRGTAPRPRQRRTPAQYIITPTVTAFEVTGGNNDGYDLPVIGIHIGGNKTKTTLALNLRISDAETSETFASFSAEGQVECKSQDIKFLIAGASGEQSKSSTTAMNRVVDDALKNAVSKISQKLEDMPWYAVVAARDPATGRVVIAAGGDSGIESGMEFAINRTGGIIRDEDGDIISRGDESPIGRVRVVRVERGAAFADVISGKGFASGNIVRLLP